MVSSRVAFEDGALAPIALDRARVLTPVGIAAIAWYSTVGRVWGIELTSAAAAYNAASCLLLAAMWWALAGGRVPVKWGHAALSVLWLVCVSATLQSRVISDSHAFDFLMLLEILCACMLLQTRSAVVLIAMLDVGYALAANNIPPAGIVPAAVACNILAIALQVGFRRAELCAALQERAQLRRATSRALQLVELETLQRERAVLAEQVAASQRIEASGTLAASLAHELNNLFSTISLSAGLLLRTAKAERRQEFQIIMDESARGSGLTGKLLEFSRSSSTARTLRTINKVVADATGLMARMLPPMIELDVKIETDASVLVDQIQLSQVLLNLSLNAARALDSSGTIMLRARRVAMPDGSIRALELAPASYVELAVVDRGRGMDRATRVRAMEPFFTTQVMGNGTGLGLSTAWNILRAHGGTLTIESELGAGTTVKAYVPVFLGAPE